MCERGDSVDVGLPEWMCTYRQNRTVRIDRCIYRQITALWRAGFITLGCCCGHGKMGGPSLVVPDTSDDEAVSEIRGIVEEYDDREWDIQLGKDAAWRDEDGSRGGSAASCSVTGTGGTSQRCTASTQTR